MASPRDFLSLIKFAHSVFALPFALMVFLVAVWDEPDFPWHKLGLIVLAMVCARSAAMAFNRYVDREIDGRNPRTATREIPAGVVSPPAALLFTALASAGFLWVCWFIAPICLWLGIPVLLVLLLYSYAKRFTAMAHAWLGMALGLAPPAAHVAARGAIYWDEMLGPELLGLGVLCWVTGFDILYSCQDEDFDRETGLHSIPARFGRRTALRIAVVLHMLSVPLFLSFGLLSPDLGLPYTLGVVGAGVLLFFEHRLIRPDDMSRVNLAFFTMNGLVSLGLLLCTLLDLLL